MIKISSRNRTILAYALSLAFHGLIGVMLIYSGSEFLHGDRYPVVEIQIVTPLGRPKPLVRVSALPSPKKTQNKEISKAGLVPDKAAGQPESARSGVDSVLDVSNLKMVSGNLKPAYSYTARLRRMEGTVVARARVREDGSMDTPVLEQSSGYNHLDELTLKAMSQWRWAPGTTGIIRRSFVFKLRDQRGSEGQTTGEPARF